MPRTTLASALSHSHVMRSNQFWSVIFPLTIFSSLAVWPALAKTITVTNNSDSGSGSLRDAIATAKSGDTINFHLTALSTIIILSSPLSISTRLTISGSGASNPAISGNRGVSGVIQIASGTDVHISGVTIENGTFGGSNGLAGGGILSEGTLTLTSAAVSGNIGFHGGGGITNRGGH
jgi:hypothetical protein